MTAILVISDREPLSWLLREQRFAIPQARLATAPPVGSDLLLYTTRGCYRNPTRDRGLVMGVAVVTVGARQLEEPVRFGDRDYGAGFSLDVKGVAPPHVGVDLGSLAGRLDALPDATSWSVRLRRSFVPLNQRDAKTIKSRLMPMLQPLETQLDAYLLACHVKKHPAVPNQDEGSR